MLRYLKEYLTLKNTDTLHNRLSSLTISYKERAEVLKLLRLKNYYGEITLLSYCLMPNHFHFFLKQKSSGGMDQFMQSLFTRYTMYFNLRHKRTGKLCQDIYKAAPIVTEPQFIYISKYIHRQAVASKGSTFQSWEGQPSSYEEYLGQRKTEWVHPEEVLAYFPRANPAKDYKKFVEEQDLRPVGNVLLEE